MNLPKAIELNKEAIQSLKKGKFHDHADAVQLGTEALKHFQKIQAGWVGDYKPTLPGETPVSDSP